MFFRNIKNRRNKISDVIVARIWELGWAASSQKREGGYLYLLVFLPLRTQDKVGKGKQEKPQPEDYLIFLDRTGARKKVHFYRALFTVSESLKRAGFNRFTFLDLSSAKSDVEAKTLLFDEMERRKGPTFALFKAWLEERKILDLIKPRQKKLRAK